MLNMMVMSDFLFEASITSEKKVDFPRLESNMADDNVEGDMEVEAKNPAASAYSNEINIIINGKTNQICISFYLQSNLSKNPENLNLVP